MNWDGDAWHRKRADTQRLNRTHESVYREWNRWQRKDGNSSQRGATGSWAEQVAAEQRGIHKNNNKVKRPMPQTVKWGCYDTQLNNTARNHRWEQTIKRGIQQGVTKMGWVVSHSRSAGFLVHMLNPKKQRKPDHCLEFFGTWYHTKQEHHHVEDLSGFFFTHLLFVSFSSPFSFCFGKHSLSCYDQTQIK